MRNKPGDNASNVANLSVLFKKIETIAVRMDELEITSSAWRKTQSSGFSPEDQPDGKRTRFEKNDCPQEESAGFRNQ